MTHRISDVRTLEDFVVSVIFQNGIEKEYDIKKLFEVFPQFMRLMKDNSLYESVQVDAGGYGISWNDDLDLSAEEIWDNGVERKVTHGMEIGQQVGYKLTSARNDVNITQKELAENTQIYQADISKIERGLANPSIKTLQRLAEGMGMELQIEFVPRKATFRR